MKAGTCRNGQSCLPKARAADDFIFGASDSQAGVLKLLDSLTPQLKHAHVESAAHYAAMVLLTEAKGVHMRAMYGVVGSSASARLASRVSD